MSITPLRPGSADGRVPDRDHPSSTTATADEVKRALERARRAQRVWGALSFRERARYLRRVRKALVADVDGMVATIVDDTGKLPTEALVNEVLLVCELMRYYERHGGAALATRRVRAGLLVNKAAEVRYEPLGVVGVISPWNYPLVLALGAVVTALFAGNTVLLKPSEITPHVGLAIGALFDTVADQEDGLGDLVQVLVGAGSVGEMLVRSGVDKVSFTGSVATGKAVMRCAADTLTPVLLELGGKDPMVVCDDANLDRAAHAAVWGAFTNSGQTCMAVERVYVTAAVYDAFVGKVVDATRKLRQGSGRGHDVGPMTWDRQTEIVRRHLDDAIERGATVAVGGKSVTIGGRPSIEPTVLLDVDDSMLVMREETFGPILPIMEVADAAEALTKANASAYGLNSSIWTRDPVQLEQMIAGLEDGSVCVNDCLISYAIPALPFGGVKSSGVGRAHGIEGLREFSKTKSVARDRIGLRNEPLWLPVPRWLDRGARILLRLRHGL